MRAIGANREVIATDALTVARLADAVLSQQHGQEDHRTVLGITVLIPIGAGNADCYTAARSAVTAPSGSGRVVGREEITSSTIRYSFACSAVMKKSRSVSRWIFSMDWPVWWARIAVGAPPAPHETPCRRLLGRAPNLPLPPHSPTGK